MLETLTRDSFAPYVGETFRTQVAPDHTIDLVLAEARAIEGGPARTGPPPTREPFALLFKGPAAIILPQQIYRIEHDAMGAYDLFIVPIGHDAERTGILYEAIFT